MQQVQQPQQEQIILPIGSVVRNVNGDRYTVEGVLGKGGSGAVYLVRDRRNKQDFFALKELIDPDRQERERFAFEAEVLMRLDYEALPHVYHVFENEKLKRVYILMDYIEGQDLEALRQEEPNNRFSLHLVLTLLTPIVAAINHLHHREPPIVHRDIKPANIVVPAKGGNAPLLVDFGIAKEYTDDGTTTVIRHGSPGYAALEQYGGGTNISTDVYGLGATLYTLLTGTVPPDALTRVTSRYGVDPLKPAHELIPELPIGVSNAISRALSIGRDDRFTTIDEFWEELNEQAKDEQTSAEQESETIEKSVVQESETIEKSVVQESGLTEKLAPPILPIARTRKNIVPMTLEEGRQIAHSQKRRRAAFTLLGTLLAFLLAATGITAFILHMPHTSTSRVTPTISHTPPTATPTIDQAPYPTLGLSYKGRMHDWMNDARTDTSLKNVQQNKSAIHGFCNCLGLSGSFNGTVSIDGSITFTVKFEGRETGILFEGNIKTGGGMAGQFYIITVSNGQHTGEYGDWSFVE